MRFASTSLTAPLPTLKAISTSILLSSLLLLFAQPLLADTTTLLPANASIPSPSSTFTDPTPTPCPKAVSGYTNKLIRAPIPNSPHLSLTNDFLSAHILFYYTTPTLNLPQSQFAQYCLEQCVAYTPNYITGTDGFTITPGTIQAAYAVTNRTGPCRSFTVDQGKPFPPNAKDTQARWFCEGFDREFKEDLSDFEEVRGEGSEGSYLFGMAVNRACGTGGVEDLGYRFF